MELVLLLTYSKIREYRTYSYCNIGQYTLCFVPFTLKKWLHFHLRGKPTLIALFHNTQIQRLQDNLTLHHQ